MTAHRMTTLLLSLGVALSLLLVPFTSPAGADVPSAGGTAPDSDWPTTSTVTERLAGTTRYGTAAAISRRQFPSTFAAGQGTAYLARGDVLTDAMVGGTLTDGPVLLVRSCGEPPDVTVQEVARLQPARVVALGGSGAVCDETLEAVAGGRPTDRLAGATRYETAARIAAHAFPGGPVDELYLATGAQGPDAAVAGTLTEGPILLVPGDDSVPAATRHEIERLDPGTVVAIGGTGSVPEAALRTGADGRPTDRVSGVDRYATSAAIASHGFQQPRTVYLTRGDIFPDAVTAGVLTDGPVLLTRASTCGQLPTAVRDYLEVNAPERVVAIGGAGAVCDETLRYAAQIATPLGPRAACLDLASRLSSNAQVGQLFMLGKDSTTPVDEAYGDILRETRTGSVVLVGNTSAGTAGVRAITDQLRDESVSVEGVGLVVAADQEGGNVQRLQGPGFDRIPSATQQGTWSNQTLLESAERWGRQLREAGVDIDLAPVADVVPPDMVDVNEPIGLLRRHYGTSVDEVTPDVIAFDRGMARSGVATSLKHFPGLGHVVGNTDHNGNVVDDVVDRHDPGLRAFTDAAAAGADSIMMSLAIYSLIDPDNPAAFSSVVIEDLLREQLGYQELVISDDLGATQQVAGVPPRERALRFLTAGGDVVINVDPAIHSEMVDAVRRRVAADEDFAWEVTVKTARVITLKERLGAAACG